MKSLPSLLTSNRIAMSLSFAIIAGGCAYTQENIDDDEYSGFLDDYSILQEVDSEHLSWQSEKLAAGNYTKIIFDKVEVIAQGSEQQHEYAELITKVRQQFDKTMRTELAKELQLVTEAGPGVLRVQTALSNHKSEALGMTGWEIMPVGATVGIGMAATGTRPRITQMVLEAKLSDSVSGELMAAGIKKGSADQENYEQITMEDFMVIVAEFTEDAGKRLNEALQGK